MQLTTKLTELIEDPTELGLYIHLYSYQKRKPIQKTAVLSHLKMSRGIFTRSFNNLCSKGLIDAKKTILKGRIHWHYKVMDYTCIEKDNTPHTENHIQKTTYRKPQVENSTAIYISNKLDNTNSSNNTNYSNNSSNNISEKSKKTKKCLFRDSMYYDFNVFAEKCPADWAIEKITKWYSYCINYSDAKGAKYINWVAAVINWDAKNPKKETIREMVIATEF